MSSTGHTTMMSLLGQGILEYSGSIREIIRRDLRVNADDLVSVKIPPLKDIITALSEQVLDSARQR